MLQRAKEESLKRSKKWPRVTSFTSTQTLPMSSYIIVILLASHQYASIFNFITINFFSFCFPASSHHCSRHQFFFSMLNCVQFCFMLIPCYLVYPPPLPHFKIPTFMMFYIYWYNHSWFFADNNIMMIISMVTTFIVLPKIILFYNSHVLCCCCECVLCVYVLYYYPWLITAGIYIVYYHYNVDNKL